MSPSKPNWPSTERQMAESQAEQGSELQRLIRDNQDLHLLHPDEANDKAGVPPWLRVYWRKQHPEMVYSPNDPAGGYPRVLKNIYSHLLANQGFKAKNVSPPEEEAPNRTISTNLRISGAQTTPRSESDIRVNYGNPAQIIAASNGIGGDGSQAQYYSTDGGVTWGQTELPLVTGDDLQSDPTVDWTSDGTAWATTIGISGASLQLRAYKSTDVGATWTHDAIFSGGQTNADKQMMWVDHSPSSPFKDNIYVIWHNGLPAFVNRRTGPSGAWQTPLQVSGAETTGTAIGGDIKTNSAGDVFAFWPGTGSRGLYVAKSTDGGASFSSPIKIATTFDSYDIGVPSFSSRRALIYISGGAYRTQNKDLVYASWVDLSGEDNCSRSSDEPGGNASSRCKTRMWFTRSTDGGATWEQPRMINNQPSLNDQYNHWLVVDETNGTLVLACYDTVADAGRLKTDLWCLASFNDGVTWSPPSKVTTAQTDETGGGADTGNQYGDYIGLSGVGGRFFPAWTDRRSGAREEIWTAALMPEQG